MKTDVKDEVVDIMDAKRDRIFEGNVFEGTDVVYGATPRHVTPFVCDVSIYSLHETNVRETRAYRRSQKARDKKVPRLRHDTLHDEMFVVFGPEMAPADAIKALHSLANNIGRNGLLIGRVKDKGDSYVETIEGKILR